MEEERQQAYFELVRDLLQCDSGTEPDILAAHPELVDEGLVRMLLAVAQMMTEENDPESASTIEWLQDFATQLAQELGLNLESNSEDVDSGLDFLMSVFQAIDESNGNPQVVHPLFRDNLSLLNERLIYSLTTWHQASFAELDEDGKQSITVVIGEFAILIAQFPLGSRLINLEIAIASYRLALEVYTYAAYPYEWAMNHMNLANAYRERIRGERAENLEQAIASYRLALEVYTYAAYPYEWAATQMNLANAYSERIRGERAENLEQAIGCFRLALEVRTQDAYPEQWAMTRMNLANVYRERIQGERAENLEESINNSRSTLEVYTCAAYPEQWAMTHMNLANAYRERIWGERLENLEESIGSFQLALDVYTRDAYPERWAMTQIHLANAYSDRIRGERAENLEEAIICYRLTLEVYTRAAYPEWWAMTHMNLANAYSERIRGERAKNLEESIGSCQLVLEVYTHAAYPERWATTQMNLAVAYQKRIWGERAENLEQAIACSRLALEVYTRAAYPERWAMTHMNLAVVYNQRIQGERPENLEESLVCFRLALEVYTRMAYPEQWAMTNENMAILYTEEGDNDLAIRHYQLALEIFQPEALPLAALKTNRGLGNIYFNRGDWQLAIESYERAIIAVETSRNWATSEASRQEILGNAISVYEYTIQAYINLGRIDKAIIISERARSRQLVDLMAAPDLYADGEIPDAVKAYLADYQSLERQIHQIRTNRADDSPDAQRQLSGTRNRAALDADTAEIAQLEAEKQIIWQKIRQFDPILAGQQQVIPIDIPSIRSTIERAHTAILSFYTTDNDTHIFILTHDREPQIHTCTGQGLENFQLWLRRTWVNPYIGADIPAQITEAKAKIDLAAAAEKPELEADLAESIEQLKTHGLLGAQSWQDLMPDTLAEIACRLELDTLIAKLPKIEELIIIPHLYLHHIPFAALPIFTSQEGLEAGSGDGSISILSDKFTIRYAPSCQILKYCTDRRAAEATTQYGTVENADGTLPGTGFEVEQVSKLLGIHRDYRLQGREEATIDNFLALLKHPTQPVTHFLIANHAQSRLDRPLESSIKLAGGNLNLAKLMISRYPHLQEIVLSCCETHFGTTAITDDLLTLGTGFLCAGARTVISTLWSVNDIATALFSIFYYSNRDRHGRAESLKMAQVRLRELSGKTFESNFAADFNDSLVTYAKKIKAERTALDRQFQDGAIDQITRDDRWHELTKILDKTLDYGERIDKYSQSERPFEHPFYWAGFICQGLA